MILVPDHPLLPEHTLLLHYTLLSDCTLFPYSPLLLDYVHNITHCLLVFPLLGLHCWLT